MSVIEASGRISTKQFGKTVQEVDAAFANNVTAWAADNVFGEGVCGPVRYQLEYADQDASSLPPLDDLVTLEHDPDSLQHSILLEPRSTVPVGDYLVTLTG